MQDLAWFLFPVIVDLGALEGRQHPQGTDRALRVEVERLQSGNEAIPPERSDVPRDAGGGQFTVREHGV